MYINGMSLGIASVPVACLMFSQIIPDDLIYYMYHKFCKETVQYKEY